jgi:hypothetical protein
MLYFYGSLSCAVAPGVIRGRKVGTTQSTMLPNGKVLRFGGATESATENNRHTNGVVRVKT